MLTRRRKSTPVALGAAPRLPALQMLKIQQTVRFARQSAKLCSSPFQAVQNRQRNIQVARMAGSRSQNRGDFFADLYDYAREPRRRPGRPRHDDFSAWRVIDDWPVRVPVTSEEVDVFEAWFGDILDELFEPE